MDPKKKSSAQKSCTVMEKIRDAMAEREGLSVSLSKITGGKPKVGLIRTELAVPRDYRANSATVRLRPSDLENST